MPPRDPDILTFKVTAKLISTVDVPFYISANCEMRVPFFLRPHQHLVLSDFLILAIIMVVQCHLVTLICISFIINNVKFLFMCLQLLILYSFGNICSNLFPFIIGLFDISK